MADPPDEREQKPAQATTGGWEGMRLKGMPAPERAALVVTKLTAAYRQEGLDEPPAVAVAEGIVERAILGAEADAFQWGVEAMRKAAAVAVCKPCAKGWSWHIAEEHQTPGSGIWVECTAGAIRTLKVEAGDAVREARG